MSRSPLLCPECRRTLGFRRKSGNVVFRTALEPGHGGGSVWLICDCGGRRLVEGVALMLLSTEKNPC